MEAAVALYFQFQLLIFWWFLHIVVLLPWLYAKFFFALLLVAAGVAACTLEAGIPQISNTICISKTGFNVTDLKFDLGLYK